MATGTELLFASATALSVAGSVQQVHASAAAARFNAALADREAARRREIGALQEEEFRRQTAKILSGQRARTAKAGARLDGGSPLLVMEEIAADRAFELSLLHADSEAAARSSDARSASNRLRAGSAQQAGLLNVGETLLGRASRFKIENGNFVLRS